MLQFETVSANGGTSPRRKPAVPRLPSACYKPSPAKQLTQIFKELRKLMNAEWSNIRSMNLGVRSGTAAVTDALYRQLQQLVLQLHALVIQHEEAAAVLVQLAGTLSLMEGQQLQVLLDTTGHEELSDYLKLLLKDAWSQPDWLPASALRRGGHDAATATSSSSTGSRKGSSTARPGTKSSNRLTGDLGATSGSTRSGRLGSSSLRSSREGTGASTSGDQDGDDGSTSPGRRRACSMPPAVIAEIARQRLLAEDDEVQLPPSILNKGDKSLRFRRCCHPHAPLVVTAEQLQQELQFQQELAEAEAAAAAAASGGVGQHGGSRQHSARLFGRSYGGRSTMAGDPRAFAASVRRPGTSSRPPLQQLMDLGPALSWGSDSWPGSSWVSRPTSGQLAAARAASAAARQEAARYQPLMVPCKDVETVWAEGRAAAGLTTLAVTHAEQLLLGGLDCIVLADSLSFQPRYQQQAQASSERDGQGSTPASSSRSSIRSAAMAALTANKSSSSVQGSSGAAADGRASQADSGEPSNTPGSRSAAAGTPACRGPRRSTVAWREAAGADRTGTSTTPTAGDKQASLLRPAAGQQGLGLATAGRTAATAAAGGGAGATGTVVPELQFSHIGRPSSASSSTTGLPTPPMSARSTGGQTLAATC